MKSKTSFFNAGLFRKDLTRFAPAWSIYLVGCLLVLVNTVSAQGGKAYAVLATLDNTVGLMALVNLGYGLLTALLLFGDLFVPRLCYALHAMPLRRECRFFSHLAVGLCFSLVPNLIIALFLMPALTWNWAAAFVWLAAVTTEYLFFFGVAVLCVFLTGNRFAAALVYGLLQFAEPLAMTFAETLYLPLLPGVRMPDLPMNLCPTARLLLSDGKSCFLRWRVPGVDCDGSLWPYLLILGGIALVLLAVSLLLYRRRKLECAGDFAALPILRPVFCVVFSLAAATVAQLFGALFFYRQSLNLFTVAGFVVGFFGAQMLLQRQVKVFQRRTVLRFALLTAAMALSLGLTRLDVLHIRRWTPDPSDVASVRVAVSPHLSNAESANLISPEEIKDILRLQKELIDRPSDDSAGGYAELCFTLRSGRTVLREYQFDTDSDIARTVIRYASAPETVLGYTDWADYCSRLLFVDLGTQSYSGEEARSLMEAVKADCEAGLMAQETWCHPDTGNEKVSLVWLSVCIELPDGETEHRDVTVYPDAVQTMAWLRDHNAFPEE